MEQETRDYKHYAKRIYAEIYLSDPDKYKHLSEKAIANHIKHIGFMLVRIIKTANHEFSSPYFKFSRSFLKYFNKNFRSKQHFLLTNEQMLGQYVKKDNVIDRCCIEITYKGYPFHFPKRKYGAMRKAPKTTKES